ncbi:2-hydroxyacid dehydrogenase [Celeribacter sp.]|uniref:2-hydroxyacid dehydrogenase n=1 Tax=Celeribacter sp. TaxID=1890673 RepID=UPI003A8EC2EA
MGEAKIVVMGANVTDAECAGLAQIADCHYLKSLSELEEMSQQALAAVTVLAVKGHNPLTGDTMDHFPNLGLIANFGVGYDSIDVDAASARGIKVTNTPDVLNDDVADTAVGMMLAQARELVKGDHWVRSGKWAKEGSMPLNRKMTGGTVGIVGLGRIGREIANRLAAFKMEIHYHSRSDKETPGWTYHADVVDLARAVDWLVVALVGGAETEKYVSAEAIAALGENGVVINISRGTTVDEGALLDALEAGKIAGAGLDVFVGEPDVDPRFFALDNVCLQPHQGSATHATRRAMADLQRANVAAFLKGDALLTPVN